MRKHRQDCMKICRAAGLTVLGWEARGKHGAVACSEGFVICPLTPGTQRWPHHVRQNARRLLRAARAA